MPKSIEQDTKMLHFTMGDKMKTLNEKIRDLREDHDLTQQNIADYLSIGRTMYRRYEVGETEIPLRHFVKLCKLYKVSADELLELKTKPSEPR